MAYSQHRYLNPSEPKLHWPDAMPMRASMVPLPMFNYNYPPLRCNTPYPWSRNIGGGVYGLGGILDWFPGFGPAAGGISDTLGYIKIGFMVLGGLALGYAGGFLYRELRTENRGRRGRRGARRRNGGQYEVGITSQHRYRASASERRLHGGSTVTEFLIEDPNFEGSARWNKVMGYGPSPGERRTDALRRYGAKIGQAVAGKAKPRPFQGSLKENRGRRGGARRRNGVITVEARDVQVGDLLVPRTGMPLGLSALETTGASRVVALRRSKGHVIADVEYASGKGFPVQRGAEDLGRPTATVRVVR